MEETKGNPFPDNVDKSLCTQKNPTKSKIVISSEIELHVMN
jgi:hypothetical protein